MPLSICNKHLSPAFRFILSWEVRTLRGSKPFFTLRFPRRTPRRKTASDARAAVCFLLPSLIGVTLLLLLPFAETVRRSFTNALGTTYVGLANYSAVLQNEAFLLAVRNTARFFAVCVPLLLAVSFLLAIGLRALGHLRKTESTGGGLCQGFKTSFLLPLAIPVSSIVLLWQVLFARSGIVNGLLARFGCAPVEFMTTDAAFWVLIATYVWKNSGYDMILWLTGLDAVPAPLYEAAAVDGATAWQQLWRITIPLLLPTLGLTGVLSVLNAFKVFREAYLVAGGYPHESIYLLQHLFNNWFLQLDLNRLTAAAVLAAAALLVLILPLQRVWSEDKP